MYLKAHEGIHVRQNQEENSKEEEKKRRATNKTKMTAHCATNETTRNRESVRERRGG
jgi:hypothetical protein